MSKAEKKLSRKNVPASDGWGICGSDLQGAQMGSDCGRDRELIGNPPGGEKPQRQDLERSAYPPGEKAPRPSNFPKGEIVKVVDGRRVKVFRHSVLGGWAVSLDGAIEEWYADWGDAIAAAFTLIERKHASWECFLEL